MNILVLMAGDGKRFVDQGIHTPKPFIRVNGKSILEWTLSSIPNVKKHRLIFSIRKEHFDFIDVHDSLSKICEGEPETVIYDKITRGNLETAMISFKKKRLSLSEPLLILDADNFYDGSQLEMKLSEFSGDFGSVVYFDRIDSSIKWAFAVSDPNTSRVVEIIEKDQRGLDLGGKPMVGVFYFSSGKLFFEAGEEILKNSTPTKGEFYMTQVMNRLLSDGVPVIGIHVNSVVPLGTPEDVMKFSKEGNVK